MNEALGKKTWRLRGPGWSALRVLGRRRVGSYLYVPYCPVCASQAALTEAVRATAGHRHPRMTYPRGKMEAMNLTHPETTHDVVIIGAGNAGIALAARLRRDNPDLDIAIVNPEGLHTYRPLLSYVGAGLATLRRAQRPQSKQIPAGCTWYRESVVELTPAPVSGEVDATSAHQVHTDAGRRISATDVVVCPGTHIDWDATPGLRQACASPHASTNYEPSMASATWDMLKNLRQGNAVFTISSRNAPCPSVGLKPLFLAADHWRREGRLENITMTVLNENSDFTGLPRANNEIDSRLRRLGVHVRSGITVESIDADSRHVTTRDVDGNATHWPFDALHVVPAHRGHDWVADAGIARPGTGLIDVDERTLHHRRNDGIWSLGDAAQLGTASSGGGLRRQVPVLSDNLIARRNGKPLAARYDGYSVAPIPIDRRRLILAEWDRQGHEEKTLSFISLARPRMATFAFDLFAQPLVYWHRLLKGK